MANILLNVTVDKESIVSQMKQTEAELNKKLVKETKSLDLSTRKFQVETRINKLYTDRLRLMNQLEAKESSLLTKASAYTRLGINQAQMGSAAGQYSNILKQTGGLTGPAAAAVGAAIGAGGLGSAGATRTTPYSSNISGKSYADQLTRAYGATPQYTEDISANRRATALNRVNAFRKIRTGRALDSVTSQFTAKRVGAGLIAAGYSALSEAGDITEGARATGLSAENYQRSSFAAKQSGMGNFESAYGAFKQARAGALAGGQSEQLAFKALGVSAGGDSLKEFQKLMSTIKSGSGDAEKMRGAITIFGDEADRIVAASDSFSQLSTITAQWSDNTVATLKYIGDSFKTTMGEMAAGIGMILTVAKPFIDLLNFGKSGVAGIGATLGALAGGASIGEAIDAGAAGVENQAKKYAPSPTPTTNPIDAAKTAGLALPLPDYRSNISLNKMQSQGLFIGGAPILGYQRENPVTVLKQIQVNTARTAEGLK